MIELKHVSKFYNSNGTISLGLRDINIKFNKGEFVAIIGESGAGKSTLLNVVSGIDSYDDGEILVNGEETSYFNKEDMDKYRSNYISFIHQNYQIIDSYTVLENVMLPMIIKGINIKEAEKRALYLINKVGLENRIHNRGTKLSGGEKQRLSIARALSLDTPIIACDEPTGNLDSKTGKIIIELLHEVSKDKLVLFVTHNYKQIEDYATRIVKVSDGEVVDDIVIKKIDDDIKEKLNLEITKTPNKNLFHIIKESLISTPKRTIFSFIILMVLSLSTLFMILSSTSWKDSISYTMNPSYNNSNRDRIIAYKSDRSSIDKGFIESINGVDHIFYNPFFEDFYQTFRYGTNLISSSGNDHFNGVLSIVYPKDTIIVDGCYPTNEDECFIVFPEFELEDIRSEFSYYIGKEIEPSDYRVKKRYKLSGFGSSQEAKTIMVIPKDDMSVSYTVVALSDMDIHYTNSLGEDVKVQYAISPDEEKTVLTLYGGMNDEIEHLYIGLKDIYDIEVFNYDVVYEDGGNAEPFILISLSLDLTEDAHEVSIYTKNIKKVERELKKNGYIVVLPAKNGVDESSEDYIKYLLFLGIMIVSCVVLTVVDYFIISRIYQSKDKDYAIIRSLGLTGKSMKKLQFFEILSISICSIIFSYLIVYIASLPSLYIKNIVKYNNFNLSLIYLLLMFLFSTFISYKFTKKLFKYSVSQSLKGGDRRD